MTSRPKIAFQGERGANSDEACRDHFPGYDPAPYAAFIVSEPNRDVLRKGCWPTHG